MIGSTVFRPESAAVCAVSRDVCRLATDRLHSKWREVFQSKAPAFGAQTPLSQSLSFRKKELRGELNMLGVLLSTKLPEKLRIRTRTVIGTVTSNSTEELVWFYGCRTVVMNVVGHSRILTKLAVIAPISSFVVSKKEFGCLNTTFFLGIWVVLM